MAAIPSTEFAEIIVNGRSFRDWTTVWVRRPHVGNYEFRFTATEGSPVAMSWPQLQIKPGDQCSVILAGQLACTGWVIERQASYSAQQHGILIQGHGLPIDLEQSSSDYVKNGGGQYRGYTWEQIARKELKPFGLGLIMKTSGAPDANKPFKDVQVAPGEFVHNFLERLARMRGIAIGSDENGNVVARAGPQKGGSGTDQLIEGVNIQIGWARISDSSYNNPISIAGQTNGDNTYWGRDAAQQMVTVKNPMMKRYRPLIVLAERSARVPDLIARANHEVAWQNTTAIEVEITKYGWLRGSGQLWKEAEDVFVKSPMLMINMSLGIKAVEFTQDDRGGTLTKLELANINAMYGSTISNALQGAGGGTSGSAGAEPPATTGPGPTEPLPSAQPTPPPESAPPASDPLGPPNNTGPDNPNPGGDPGTPPES